jgi:hypothetical protein
VNVNGNYSLNGNINYDLKIKKPEINIGLGTNFGANRYKNIVNNELNETNQKNAGFDFRIRKSKQKKYELGFSASADYTTSNSSIRQSVNTHYWTYEFRPDIDLYFPLKFELHTDCSINIRQKTSAFDDNLRTTYWNAWIGKKFFKQESLLIKIRANDILDQHIGFNRSVSSNYISQNTYTTIRRYFMFSIIWNFTKAGGVQPKP